MSLSFKISGHSTSPLIHLGFSEFRNVKISRVSTPFHSRRFKNCFLNQNNCRSSRSINAENNGGGGLSDAHNCSPDHEGSVEKAESDPTEPQSSNEMLKKLKRYGVAGILSYGILNTVYYLTTFLLVWFYFAPAPGRMGYAAAVKRFLKVMAMVWAGSQVTKLVRAGGALALAPFVDRGLSWFTVKFKFESQGKAFMAIVGFCIGLAVMLFLIVTLLWA